MSWHCLKAIVGFEAIVLGDSLPHLELHLEVQYCCTRLYFHYTNISSRREESAPVLELPSQSETESGISIGILPPEPERSNSHFEDLGAWLTFTLARALHDITNACFQIFSSHQTYCIAVIVCEFYVVRSYCCQCAVFTSTCITFSQYVVSLISPRTF